MNIKIILIILAVAVLGVGAGAGGYFMVKYALPKNFNEAKNILPQNGFLEGRINIGPLCPVERIPPDPRCQSTEQTFSAWPLAVYSSSKETKIADIKSDAGGFYKVKLPAGTYVVNLERKTPFARSLPKTVIIKEGETTVFDINIDTGIR
jgi:hypothetical protein